MKGEFVWMCELCNRGFRERIAFEIGCLACQSARAVALPKPRGMTKKEWFGISVEPEHFMQETA